MEGAHLKLLLRSRLGVHAQCWRTCRSLSSTRWLRHTVPAHGGKSKLAVLQRAVRFLNRCHGWCPWCLFSDSQFLLLLTPHSTQAQALILTALCPGRLSGSRWSHFGFSAGHGVPPTERWEAARCHWSCFVLCGWYWHLLLLLLGDSAQTQCVILCLSWGRCLCSKNAVHNVVIAVCGFVVPVLRARHLWVRSGAAASSRRIWHGCAHLHLGNFRRRVVLGQALLCSFLLEAFVLLWCSASEGCRWVILVQQAKRLLCQQRLGDGVCVWVR